MWYTFPNPYEDDDEDDEGHDDEYLCGFALAVTTRAKARRSRDAPEEKGGGDLMFPISPLPVD